MPVENMRTKLQLTLAAVAVVVVAVLIAMVATSVHRIEEGHVGVYFRQGALMEYISMPGLNTMAPFVTTVEQIKVRPHTSHFEDISCVTRDGIANKFGGVQVIYSVNVDKVIPLVKQFGVSFGNSLIFDRIREELKIFCANHTIDEVYNTMFLDVVSVVKNRAETNIARLAQNTVTLLNLVIPKPDIPPDIASNYKQVKVQWTEQLVAAQRQKTEQILKETELMKELADVERQKSVLQVELQKHVLKKEGEKQVLLIELQKQLLQKEGDRNVSLLEIEIAKKREENHADLIKYKKMKEAEGNEVLMTKEYVQLEGFKAIGQNTKYYFSGSDSILGAVLSKVINGDGVEEKKKPLN